MNPLRVTVSILVLVFLVIVEAASAQSVERRLEVGAQVAMVRLSDFGATSAGVGGRMSFDLSRWVAAEGEVSFFPHDDVTIRTAGLPEGPSVTYYRRRAEGFFGALVGQRGSRFGAFGKVRPGFARLTNKGVDCTSQVCALYLLAVPDYRTEFALDYGGILEAYPSARTVVRVDLGDVMIRHRSFAPPCSKCTSHNFTSRVGIGFRF